MELLSRALAAAPDDPLLLAAAVLAAWLPMCAIGLGALALAAAAQFRLGRRRPRPAALRLPPPSARPLAARRMISPTSRLPGPAAAARVALAIGAVLGFTALILASSGRLLLSVRPG